MSYKGNVVIEQDEYGFYHAYSSVLDEGEIQGPSFEEVLDGIKEPVKLFLDTWKLAGLYLQL
jgi:hypothetical protein